MSESHPVKRFSMIVCPYPIIIRGNSVLLARRKNVSYMPGMYSLPAGHEEEDESMLTCLQREVKEEIGIRVNKNHPKLMHVMHRYEEDVRMDLFFLVTEWRGTPHICEPDKCDDLGWYPINRLPPNTIPYIRKALDAWRKGLFYQEVGF